MATIVVVVVVIVGVVLVVVIVIAFHPDGNRALKSGGFRCLYKVGFFCVVDSKHWVLQLCVV